MSLWMPDGHQNSQQPAKLVHFCRPGGHLGNTNTEQVVAWWWRPVASCRSWTCYIANYMLVNIIFTSSYDVDAPRMTMYAVFVTIIANEQARTYWRPMIFPEQGGSMFHDWRQPCLWCRRFACSWCTRTTDQEKKRMLTRLFTVAPRAIIWE